MDNQLKQYVNKREDQVLGTYSQGHPGNLLLVTSAVHGNEPSGVIALNRVFESLETHSPSIKGRITGFIANSGAFKNSRRFIDEDMNRIWPLSVPDQIGDVNAEYEEMISLMEHFAENARGDYDRKFFVDCHSTSSDSLPYMSVQKIPKNMEWAATFPLYTVLGFSDLVDGTIDNFLSHNGFTGFAFEGGQHDAEDTADHHEGLIWMAMEMAGLLRWQDLDFMPETLKRLQDKESNRNMEIIYRHEIKSGDKFDMKKGFSNFDKIDKDQVLAVHNGKEIISEWDARIFMPLYQAQGNDGFFIIKEMEMQLS